MPNESKKPKLTENRVDNMAELTNQQKQLKRDVSYINRTYEEWIQVDRRYKDIKAVHDRVKNYFKANRNVSIIHGMKEDGTSDPSVWVKPTITENLVFDGDAFDADHPDLRSDPIYKCKPSLKCVLLASAANATVHEATGF